MQIFQIIRWKNLLMIVLMQVLVKYFLMRFFEVPDVLSNLQFVLLVCASLFIAAGGYIINDIFDIEIDRVNKPSNVWIPNFLEFPRAKILYASFTFFGAFLGLVLSISVENSFGFLLFFLPALLLFLYAAILKKVLIVGNVLISFLVVFSLIILIYFENIAIRINDFQHVNISSVILMLLFFAFMMNLIREIVKDVEDMKGDSANGIHSLPIQLGIQSTKWILCILIGLLIVLIGVISFILYAEQTLLVYYLIFVVLGNFLIISGLLFKAKSTTDFSRLSTYLKIIMFLGMLSVFLIKPV